MPAMRLARPRSLSGLLLIGSEEQLMARLDDGGFSHYYDYGPNATGDKW